jgi:hypothetical protein
VNITCLQSESINLIRDPKLLGFPDVMDPESMKVPYEIAAKATARAPITDPSADLVRSYLVSKDLTEIIRILI